MSDTKPITKSELLVALKEAGVATKDDVRQIVGEELTSNETKKTLATIVGAELTARGVATKYDLKGLAAKDDLRDLVTKGDLKEGLGKLERSLKRRMGQERNKVLDTIGKLATHTPTISAFRELKSKVDKAISN